MKTEIKQKEAKFVQYVRIYWHTFWNAWIGWINGEKRFSLLHFIHHALFDEKKCLSRMTRTAMYTFFSTVSPLPSRRVSINAENDRKQN